MEVYNLKLPDGFVPEKIKNYTHLSGKGYKSVENAKEAIEDAKESYNKYDSKNSELLQLELVDDEEYYCSVFISTKNKNNNVIFNGTYLYLKKDVIDIENEQININKVKNKDDVKNILNLYKYVFPRWNHKEN